MNITIRKVLPKEAYEYAVLQINCQRDAYTRGIHFYEKYGMIHDGAEKEMQLGKPLKCIRYVL